jgi:hypothetical protein
LLYNCINVDALSELGIILSAWYSGTSCSNTPYVKEYYACPTSFLMCKG